MKLGVFLKELRIKNNLTIMQVEVKTNISNSYISLIERGKRRPSVEILHKLAKAYRVKTEDLLRFIGYLPPIQNKINFNQIPIYSIVPKQKPFFVSENIEGYSPNPAEILELLSRLEEFDQVRFNQNIRSERGKNKEHFGITFLLIAIDEDAYYKEFFSYEE